jgi:hypothetical protein
MIDFTDYIQTHYRNVSGSKIEKRVGVLFSDGMIREDTSSLAITGTLYVHRCTTNEICIHFCQVEFEIETVAEQIYHLGYIGI